MNPLCDTTLSVLVGIMSVLYLAFQVYRKRWSAIASFVVILVALCGIQGFTMMPTQLCCVCALLAIVGSNVVSLPQTLNTTSSVESFADPKEEESAKPSVDHTEHTHGKKHDKNPKQTSTSSSKGKKTKTSLNHQDDDDDSDSDSESDNSSTKNKRNGGNHNKKKSKKENDPEHVDNFSTFMETYKSLNPDQIETMTSDTQDLISTQQALMDTVKSMAPVISQGKEMMDTFKDYFGPNNTSDLLKAFKPQN